MKHAFLLFTFLLAACVPHTTIELTPTPPGTLQPYFTRTPSVMLEEPESLVVAFETPLPTSTPFTYQVQVGDTMSGIAFKFGVSLDELVAINPGVSPNSMSIGTELKIPSNPTDQADASTSTPVPATVEQIACHPTADRGMWCFVLVHNDTQTMIENLSAQVTLQDTEGDSLASSPALSPLNILPPGDSLPLMVFFPPEIPPDANPLAQLLTGIHLQLDDARYLPATLHNTLAQIDSLGRNAQVSGTVRLPKDAQPASLVWVAAVAYDEFGRVVGVRRWESDAGVIPGGSLEFAFEVSSVVGKIERVEFVVEARP